MSQNPYEPPEETSSAPAQTGKPFATHGQIAGVSIGVGGAVVVTAMRSAGVLPTSAFWLLLSALVLLTFVLAWVAKRQ